MGTEEIAKLMVGVGGDTSALATSFAGISPMLGKLGGMFSHFGAVIIPAAFVAAGIAIAGFAIKAAKYVGSGFRIIKQRTGEVGPALEKLGEDYRKVLGQVPEQAKVVGEAMALIRQRTGEIGKPLQDMTKQLLDLARITDSDVKPLVDAATGAFNVWNIATKDQSAALDYLYKVSAATGANINALIETTRNGAPVAQMLGWSFEKVAAFTGQLTKEGLDANRVFMGMKMSLGKLAKAGKDPQVEFPKMMNAIKGAKTETEALQIAIELFGARVAGLLVAPIRQGKLGVDDFMDSLKKGGPTIDDTAKRTYTLGDMIDQLKNIWNLALEPLGKPILQGLKSAVEWGIRNMPAFQKAIKDSMKVVKDWGEGVKQMGDWFDKAAVKFHLSNLYLEEAFAGGKTKLNIQSTIADLQLQLDTMNGTTKEHMGEFKNLWDRGLDDVAKAFIAKTPALKGAARNLTGAILANVRLEDLADVTGAQIDRMAAKIAQDTGLPVEAVRELLRQMQAAMLKGELHPIIGDIRGDSVGKAREVIVSMQQFLNDNPLSIWAKILTQSAARIWDHAADAGAYLANEIASGGNAVGAFINIGAGIGGAGMGELTTDVNKLQAAWDAMNKTVIGGFNVGAINKQFTEMRDAIGAVAQEQTGSSEAAAEAANTWSNLRNELDAANAKLNETGKVLEASEAQCNLWQHQIDLNSQAITRFQHANEIAQESINRLSSIKITGEAEADEKSFQTTQAINKLKLQILQAEQAHNYALASKLKLQVNELEKQKEIDDLAASITYDPQRREIEAALDPLHDQSETLQNILAGIRDQEGLIKANNAQMDILNAQNWDLEQKIIAERDRVWEMKIEYENTRKEVENLGAAINDMGANAVARWHEITAAIEAHNAALARAGGGAATPHHAGGLVMHTGGEVLAILKRKEFVMQEPAVEKYGTGFMNAVNSGSLPGGSPITVGDIHLHSVSPEYDVQQFYKLLNDTARRGAHLGRVLKGAKA